MTIPKIIKTVGKYSRFCLECTFVLYMFRWSWCLRWDVRVRSGCGWERDCQHKREITKSTEQCQLESGVSLSDVRLDVVDRPKRMSTTKPRSCRGITITDTGTTNEKMYDRESEINCVTLYKFIQQPGKEYSSLATRAKVRVTEYVNNSCENHSISDGHRAEMFLFYLPEHFDVNII